LAPGSPGRAPAPVPAAIRSPRLHVFGGPWTYASERSPGSAGVDRALFAGFDAPLRIEPTEVVQSSLATHVTYRVLP
jgi:hypothetical protein